MDIGVERLSVYFSRSTSPTPNEQNDYAGLPGIAAEECRFTKYSLSSLTRERVVFNFNAK